LTPGSVQTGSGTAYGFEVAPDQHGTNTLYLDDTAQNPSLTSIGPRWYDPVGDTSMIDEWAATRGTGEISPFTQDIIDAIIDVIRVPKP
jgi:hypothetical protein